ncbi:MAG: DUF305 domain-containing protein [Arachnia sp.]
MKTRLAAAALALAAAVTLAGCSSTPPAHEGSHAAASTKASSAADVNDADAMFATMMIPHHEQAIEMADMLLAKDGIDKQVVDLAEAIKAAQGPEIEQLKGWLSAWGVDTHASGHDGHGDGMMSHDDMAALEKATGAAATSLFLEQMIEHHEGAVEMAEAELTDGKNADAVALAQRIVDAQTAEIAEMRALLGSQ